MFCCFDSSHGDVCISRQSAEAMAVGRADCHKSHIHLLKATLKQQRHFTEKYWDEVSPA